LVVHVEYVDDEASSLDKDVEQIRQRVEQAEDLGRVALGHQ
jgi:hypothetical protein